MSLQPSFDTKFTTCLNAHIHFGRVPSSNDALSRPLQSCSAIAVFELIPYRISFSLWCKEISVSIATKKMKTNLTWRCGNATNINHMISSCCQQHTSKSTFHRVIHGCRDEKNRMRTPKNYALPLKRKQPERNINYIHSSTHTHSAEMVY